MTETDRERWDRRYRGDGSLPSAPSPLLQRYSSALPGDRALDVATGTGRNALFLAEAGYDVDAVDISRVALRRAREEAAARALSVDWIQADLDDFVFPTEAYDVVTVSFYYLPQRLPDLVSALEPGGVLVYEHALKTTDPVDRGPSDRHRYDSNQLLDAARAGDLTVLFYEEAREDTERGVTATARLVARNTAGAAQSYPWRPDGNRV